MEMLILWMILIVVAVVIIAKLWQYILLAAIGIVCFLGLILYLMIFFSVQLPNILKARKEQAFRQNIDSIGRSYPFSSCEELIDRRLINQNIDPSLYTNFRASYVETERKYLERVDRLAGYFGEDDPKAMAEHRERLENFVRGVPLFTNYILSIIEQCISRSKITSDVPPDKIVVRIPALNPLEPIDRIIREARNNLQYLPSFWSDLAADDVDRYELLRAIGEDSLHTLSPFELDDETRFRHQWVVAPSGTGKTTLLQTQIIADIDRAIAGGCSVIVIDSQNELIPKIARLNVFAPGAPGHGKLVLIEPDPNFPPAFNILDVGISELSERERIIMQAEALENIKSCLATMADTQDDMLSYIVELCLVVPGATIQDIVNILKPDGMKDYKQYLPDVDQVCRDYFETTFSPRSQGTNATKEALLRRLMGMLRNPTFRKMFLNKRNKFSMKEVISSPKVILINTDLNFLGKEACQLFGRFFIAQLLQASGSRGSSSLPVFCYVDECQDYIANDDNAATLIDKARKRRIGMIFVHQRMVNIQSANVIDALTSVAVRIAGANENDASFLAKSLRTSPDFIMQRTKGTFACWVRDKTPKAVELVVPPDALESRETMSDQDFIAIRAEMRAKYAVDEREAAAKPEPDAPQFTGITIDAVAEDVEDDEPPSVYKNVV